MDLDAIRQKVKDKVFTQRALGAAAGMTDSQISNVLNGVRRVQIEEAAKIRDFLSKHSGAAPRPDAGAPSTDECGNIPVYDLNALAGPGAFAEDGGAPLYRITFGRECLSSITDTPAEKLAAIIVAGDSMEPALRDRDTVLVDMSSTRTHHNGIYCIRFDDAISIRRVTAMEQSGNIHVSSDNATYASYDANPDDVSVIGRVIWIGRKV